MTNGWGTAFHKPASQWTAPGLNHSKKSSIQKNDVQKAGLDPKTDQKAQNELQP